MAYWHILSRCLWMVLNLSTVGMGWVDGAGGGYHGVPGLNSRHELLTLCVGVGYRLQQRWICSYSSLRRCSDARCRSER